MKHILRVAGLAVAVSGVSGCSWLWDKDEGYLRDRGSDYLHAEVMEPMQVPDNMQAKQLDALLPVPSHVATVSNRQARDVPRPQRLSSGPQADDFSLQQGSGQAGWIVAQRIPAQVWPLAQAFFEEHGFIPGLEKPHLGEFVTQWHSLSSLNQDFVRQAGLAGSDEVRYRVRIEPGVARNTSEVFLDLARDEGAAWNADQASPALVLMQQFFQKTLADGDSYSLLASRSYDAPRSVVMLELPNGARALRLDASFDRAWSGVGRALHSAYIHVADVNRAQGVYFIDPDRAAEKEENKGFFKRLFSRSSKKKAIDTTDLYLLKLTTIGHQVFVSLEKKSDTLAEPELTQRVLTAVQEQLN